MPFMEVLTAAGTRRVDVTRGIYTESLNGLVVATRRATADEQSNFGDQPAAGATAPDALSVLQAQVDALTDLVLGTTS